MSTAAKIGFIGVALLFLALGGAMYLFHYFDAPGPLSAEKIVVIDPGTPFRAIVRKLDDNGVIEAPRLFEAIVMIRREPSRFKAGEYAFPAGATPRKVAEIIASGKGIIHSLTLPEGRTVADFLALLQQAEALSPAPLTRIPEEGSLLPETYHFLRGDTRDAVAARMRSAMDSALAAAWSRRDPDLPLASPAEARILASIVEKETGIASERSRVAAVFINRLRIGMRLQSDPTTLYGLFKENGAFPATLTYADLAQSTAFNTYVIPALPPSPICNPGKASLEAVLHPAKTEDLYFVATGDGGHAFATTLKEHQRNVAAYRVWQRQNR